jgi:hypothetical protein
VTPRELRDRLEVLTTELADAKAALAKATTGRAARIAQLEVQEAALATQCKSLEGLVERKRADCVELSERLARARKENPVPQVPPPIDSEGHQELDTGFLYVLFGETPDYAKSRGWWRRLVSRVDLVMRR